jgi:hypothetical protein
MLSGVARMGATETRHMTPRTQALAAEALDRARSSASLSNLPAVYAGFAEKGVPPESVLPRVNVLTFWAWKALGRSVRKGEHGVRVLTWVPVARDSTDAATGETRRTTFRRPKGAVVFHVSQTDPIPGRETFAVVPTALDLAVAAAFSGPSADAGGAA